MPIGQGRVKAEGEGVEPSRLIARPASNGVPSPIGLPFHKAAVAGIEPASGRLTAAYPYQHGSHRNENAGRPDLNRRSCAQGTSNPGFPASSRSRAPSGSRTRTSASARRQAAATSWARYKRVGLSKINSTGRDSNPRDRNTGAVSSPLDDQCGFVSGTRGT